MYKFATGQIEQVDTDAEVLSLIREAEHLEKVSLVCFDIDMFADESKPVSPDTPGEVESNDEGDILDNDEIEIDSPGSLKEEERDEEGDAFDIVACTAQVQSAALSVVDEACKLQSETERYTLQLIKGATGDPGESAPSQWDRTNDSNYDIMRKALAVTREAERLQEIVVRLLADVIEADVSGKTNDD